MKNNLKPEAQHYGFWSAVVLAGVLAVLFWRSFLPGYVHFSNDNPLGNQVAAWTQLPGAFTGAWADTGDTGGNAGAWAVEASQCLRWLIGPVGFAKFFPPIALLILGLGAWAFFRQLKLSPLAALLGALAAMLNSAFFSGACWGVAAQEIGLGMDFFALALVLASATSATCRVRWAQLALAGLCVGMNVMEAADIGALCSVFVAVFVFYRTLAEETGGMVSKSMRGIRRVAVVAVFAGFLATQTVVSLVSTQIEGVAGTGQDTESKAEHWDWATQWSLPKLETLGLVVPGLFGYKMDTPQNMMPAFTDAFQGGVYWGGMGRGPEIDRFLGKIFHPGDEVNISINTPDHPNQDVTLNVGSDGNINAPVLGQINVAGLSGLKLKEKIDQSYAAQGIQGAVEQPAGFMRFSGGGIYCGILVALLAAWAVAQSFRRQDSPFSLSQKRLIWFWLVVLVLSLLLSWGRFAPFFYGLLYRLPYFSTIRNPAKFLIFFCWALVVLFAYGVHTLSLRHLGNATAKPAGPVTQLKIWWSRAGGFDRKWTLTCLGVLGISVAGGLVFWGESNDFVTYLQNMGFPDETTAKTMAAFSLGQVAWFIGLLAVAILLVTLIIAGFFSGPRTKTGAVLLGAFLIFDMGRANLPYITHWDYKLKYEVGALNPIEEFLRDKPYEHRVAELPFKIPSGMEWFDQLYRIEWMQHHFPYYNIQSLDVVQMPRVPEDLKMYLEALAPNGTAGSVPRIARHWELTNTRYLLGPAGYLDVLNQQLDPVLQRFRIVQRFEVSPKPGILQPTRLEELTAVPDANGRYALFDFTGALPRAKLYSNWQVNTNDQAVLKTLADLNFNPAQTVLVDTPGKNLPTAATNENSGTVTFKSYAPKHIVFTATANDPSVLLLNDKYDPNWKVTVDDRPAELLRCNFYMRGVFLPAGQHTVEFVFNLPDKPLYVTLVAMGIGLGLVIWLLFARKWESSAKR